MAQPSSAIAVRYFIVGAVEELGARLKARQLQVLFRIAKGQERPICELTVEVNFQCSVRLDVDFEERLRATHAKTCWVPRFNLNLPAMNASPAHAASLHYLLGEILPVVHMLQTRFPHEYDVEGATTDE